MNGPGENPVSRAFNHSRAAFWVVGLFSVAINLLMLVGPLFMLQIYDRVLTSRSVPTLIVLFGLVAALYGIQGIFEFLRSKILTRIGNRFDLDIMSQTNRAWILSGVSTDADTQKPILDLTTIRKFISSNGLPALFDLPWVPFYLAVVFLLHVWLGWLATAGAFVVLSLTLLNELITKKHIAKSTQAERIEASFSQISHRNSEAIVAMGMISNITAYWKKLRIEAIIAGLVPTNRTGSITSITKTFRLALQSGILALGAYLAIYQEITAGTMIAASILAGRALAPVDMAIGNWQNFIKARQSYSRLKKILISFGNPAEIVELPAPKGYLALDNVTKIRQPTANGAGSQPILQRISFQLNPGDGLGVIGPSGSGKSSLARLIVGLWMAERGEVRLDGANYNQWDRDRLGGYIGYLPQSVELMPGSIKENIARFDPQVTDEEVIEAAQIAGVHELITSFPEGYASKLSAGQTVLSAGQAQRIALARAVLCYPPLVVLDEPNSNLDAEGDAALTNAIGILRSKNSTVVVMAHRPSAISAVNKILVLKGGRQMEFGEKAAVLKKITRIASDDLDQNTG